MMASVDSIAADLQREREMTALAQRAKVSRRGRAWLLPADYDRFVQLATDPFDEFNDET